MKLPSINTSVVKIARGSGPGAHHGGLSENISEGDSEPKRMLIFLLTIFVEFNLVHK